MKTRYKFSHRSNDGTRLFWVATSTVTPNDSRTEHIICRTDYFWGVAA